jgi:uncharacterized membrane-anchored protein YhcB (DUF1043 family)
MTDKKDQKGGMSPGAAAAIGAVVGAAAVGIAGAAVLANKESRKTVEKVIDDAKDKVSDMKEGVEGKIAEGQKKVNKVATAVKDASHDVAKAAK